MNPRKHRDRTNSRERLLVALNRSGSDRVPLETGVHNIQADLLPQDVTAMSEALHENGVS